jgi:hypothetical protein
MLETVSDETIKWILSQMPDVFDVFYLSLTSKTIFNKVLKSLSNPILNMNLGIDHENKNVQGLLKRLGSNSIKELSLGSERRDFEEMFKDFNFHSVKKLFLRQNIGPAMIKFPFLTKLVIAEINLSSVLSLNMLVELDVYEIIADLENSDSKVHLGIKCLTIHPNDSEDLDDLQYFPEIEILKIEFPDDSDNTESYEITNLPNLIDLYIFAGGIVSVDKTSCLNLKTLELHAVYGINIDPTFLKSLKYLKLPCAFDSLNFADKLSATHSKQLVKLQFDGSYETDGPNGNITMETVLRKFEVIEDLYIELDNYVIGTPKNLYFNCESFTHLPLISLELKYISYFCGHENLQKLTKLKRFVYSEIKDTVFHKRMIDLVGLETVEILFPHEDPIFKMYLDIPTLHIKYSSISSITILEKIKDKIDSKNKPKLRRLYFTPDISGQDVGLVKAFNKYVRKGWLYDFGFYY